MRTIFTSRSDLEQFGKDLENKLHEAEIFIENGDTYQEQSDRQDSLVGHLPEKIRTAIVDYLSCSVEWKDEEVSTRADGA